MFCFIDITCTTVGQAKELKKKKKGNLEYLCVLPPNVPANRWKDVNIKVQSDYQSRNSDMLGNKDSCKPIFILADINLKCFSIP